jgi:hypothetical protein
MDAGASVLWPERESLHTLMCLRATIGPASFASEKQGDPVNPEQCEWDSSYFDYPGFWFEQWPGRLEIRTVGLDPSKGKDAKTGDLDFPVGDHDDGPDALEMALRVMIDIWNGRHKTPEPKRLRP